MLVEADDEDEEAHSQISISKLSFAITHKALRIVQTKEKKT